MRTKSVPHPAAQQELDEVRAITWMMREHQQQIVHLGDRRRKIVLRLREKTPERPPVTYRNLAEAMDVSEQAVWKILSDQAEPEAAAKPPAKKAAPRKKA